jgi:hypothetical protein
VIAAGALSTMVVNLDWFALNLALPEMARDFAVPTTDLQWVVSGYMLALGAQMIPGGRLADMWGRRRMLLAGLTLFAGLSAVCAAAVFLVNIPLCAAAAISGRDLDPRVARLGLRRHDRPVRRRRRAARPVPPHRVPGEGPAGCTSRCSGTGRSSSAPQQEPWRTSPTP